MKNKKLLNSLLFLLVFWILSLVFGKDYFEFQKHTGENTLSIQEAQKSAENFELKNIQTIENPEIFYTPYEALLEKIVSKINNAEERVYLEVYMFTETRIRTAIIQAKKRGLDVQVVLEKNPYMTANINNNAFEDLQKAGVKVVWSNTKNYSLNHAKFFIIDDEMIISTWNMTYSTFKYNRDFFIIFKNKNILTSLEQIFANDFAGVKAEVYDENLVVSPNYAREKIEKLFASAQKEVQIYMQYLKDDEMNAILKSLTKKGIEVKIIINKENEDDEEIAELKDFGVQIQALWGTKMHSKIIIVDKKIMFLGSENFSHYSLDSNREMGIIFDEEESIQKVVEVFEKDWK